MAARTTENYLAEIKITFPSILEAQIFGFLYTSSINSLLEHEPNGDLNAISLYFTDAHLLDDFLELLKNEIATNSSFCSVSYELLPIVEENWQTTWKEHWNPQHISDSLVVVPAWHNYQPSKNEVVVKIDTTSAFGTGSHETTKLCLEIIEQNLKLEKFNSLFDFGCGSGILSIAASMLGVKTIHGYDIDPDAIVCAKHNATINNCDNIIFESQIISTKQHFEVVVANIISSVIYREWETILNLLSPGGLLIISGILQEEQSDFLKQTGLVASEIKKEGDWIALTSRQIDNAYVGDSRRFL